MRNYYKYITTNLITKKKSIYYQKHKPMMIKHEEIENMTNDVRGDKSVMKKLPYIGKKTR